MNNIPGIEEVNMIKDDGTVIHFNNPKVSREKIKIPSFRKTFQNWTKSEILLIQVQASLAANTFAVTGHAENKRKHLS